MCIYSISLHTYNCILDSMSIILYVYFLYDTLIMFDMFHVFFFHIYQGTSVCFEFYVIYLYRCEHTRCLKYPTHAYSFEAVILKVPGAFLDRLWKGDWTTTCCDSLNGDVHVYMLKVACILALGRIAT